ncbi:aldo/keto reductase [Haematococcus lacustris]|uniref:Aldo/keto reductase n=1 Tax=Haematococcus lacustris TaxID=44745 RepID=A0A6A0A1G3_HAELA|nr:aldo/keto reductase [Haematococcus lacustris]
MEAVATQRNKTMSQVAINWCCAQGTIPIPGARTLSQAQGGASARGAAGFHHDSMRDAWDHCAAAMRRHKAMRRILSSPLTEALGVLALAGAEAVTLPTAMATALELAV